MADPAPPTRAPGEGKMRQWRVILAWGKDRQSILFDAPTPEVAWAAIHNWLIDRPGYAIVSMTVVD